MVVNASKTPVEDRISSVESQDTREIDQLDKPTPLPILQLLSVYLIQFGEPVTATVIYPFINKVVRETGITRGDEGRTGYYAGLIESTFFLSECLIVVQWGWLADRIGRRPVLLCAPLGLAFSMLVFGSAESSFWTLLGSRCMQGIFNGNIGVAKSVIAELTDPSNRAAAYGFMPVVWSSGVTIGPLLGGVLSNAAERWPKVFGQVSYINEHPYFLPCFSAAILVFLTFIFSFITLKETHPSFAALKIPDNWNLPEESRLITDRLFSQTSTDEHATRTIREPRPSSPEFLTSLQALKDTKVWSLSEGSHLISHAKKNDYGTHITPSSESSPFAALSTLKNTERIASFTSITTRPVIFTMLNQMFLAFMEMAHVALLPLMYSTPIEHGGLGMDPYQIGLILGNYGFYNSFFQALCFGRLIKRYGQRDLYRLVFRNLILCVGMYPIMSLFAKRAGGVDFFVSICIFVQLCLQTSISLAYGCMHLILIDCVPDGGSITVITGVAQMVGSAMRTVAPTVSLSLFALSVQGGQLGGTLVYCVLIGIAVIGVRCSRLLFIPTTGGR